MTVVNKGDCPACGKTVRYCGYVPRIYLCDDCGSEEPHAEGVVERDGRLYYEPDGELVTDGGRESHAVGTHLCPDCMDIYTGTVSCPDCGYIPERHREDYVPPEPCEPWRAELTFPDGEVRMTVRNSRQRRLVHEIVRKLGGGPT